MRVEHYRGPQYFEGPLRREWQDGHIDITDLIPIAPIVTMDDEAPAGCTRCS